MEPTIIEMTETEDGGLYVVAEYRLDPTSRRPDVVEDFTWNVIPGSRLQRRRDSAGRVLIRGEWVWPNTDVNGDLGRRADFGDAEMERAYDPDDVEDIVLQRVIEHGTKLEKDGNRGNRTLPEKRRPVRTKPKNPGLRAKAERIKNRPVTETSRDVQGRRIGRARTKRESIVRGDRGNRGKGNRVR